MWLITQSKASLQYGKLLEQLNEPEAAIARYRAGLEGPKNVDNVLIKQELKSDSLSQTREKASEGAGDLLESRLSNRE